MTSGWGVNATLNGSGVPTSGTSDSDVRKVWGSLYTPGIITGCTVTTSASIMQYTVASGVAAIKTATGETIMAPVQGTTVSTTAPSSGTRIDIIYAQQRFPDIEGDSNVFVGAASALPPRSVALATYTVTAGQTNTNSAVRSANTDYSIPYGASLGTLWYHHYQYSGAISNTSPARYGAGVIHLPTDRRVRFTITAGAVYAAGASLFDNSKYCELGFLPNYDGGDFVLWTTNGLHQAWQTLQYSAAINLTAGDHNVNYGMFKITGPGTPMMFTGASSGYGRRGIEFTVEDLGPTV